MELELLQHFAATIIFVSAAFFLLLSALLKLASCFPRRWCSCSVCRAYVSSSWSSEFDSLADWYTHLLRHGGATITIHVLCNTITADPSNVEYMLKTNFSNFPKGQPFSSILGDLLGGGIFNIDGESWRSQRKTAILELGSSAVRSNAARVVSGEVRDRLLPLLDSLGDEPTVDLQEVFRRLAFDIICKISFGIDPLYLPAASDFAAAFDTASRLSASRAAAMCPAAWRIKRWLNLGSERELRRSVRLVDEFAAEVIRQRRKIGFSDGHHDLLSRFMAAADDAADDKYLRDIVVSFLLAGRDTVAAGITGFFLLLSQNPRAASLIRDEIDRVSSSSAGGGEVREEMERMMKEMHYVHAALYESMRLYPPVQFDSRFCAGDDELPDGTRVGKGTRVTYSPYAMGRMEDIWGADAGEFRPERWLRGGGFSPESPFRYPVFHAGFRACLGKDLAIMEMKTVAVDVLRRFEVEVVEDCPWRRPRFTPGLTATLAGGLPARVRRRRS